MAVPGIGGIGGTGGTGIPRYMSEPSVSCDDFCASLYLNEPPARFDMMATLSGLVSSSPPNPCRSGGCGMIGILGGGEGICSCIISCWRTLERSFLLNFRAGVLDPEFDLSRDLLRLKKLKEPLRRREPLTTLFDSAPP